MEEVEEVAKRGKGIGGPFEKACAQVRKEVGAGIWVELDLSLLLLGQFSRSSKPVLVCFQGCVLRNKWESE